MIKIDKYEPFAIDSCGVIYNWYTKNIIKPHVDSYGYLRVSTSFNGISKNALVHRLIAEAFLPNPNNLPQINHINGIKTDNRLLNLEWVSNQENHTHAIETGLRDGILGEGSHFNKYEESLIRLICSMLEEGYRNIDISKKCGVKVSLVSDIRNGDTWKHISKYYNIVRKKRKSYSEEKIRFVCNLIVDGVKYKDIESRSGVPLHTIRDIKSKKSFKVISDDYF